MNEKIQQLLDSRVIEDNRLGKTLLLIENPDLISCMPPHTSIKILREADILKYGYRYRHSILGFPKKVFPELYENS